MKLGILALLAVGAAGIAGCEVGVHGPDGGGVEIQADTPVVYDSYYTGGHYDGNYWVWSDREGHAFRERRDFHEHRMSDPGHRAAEHREAEHHEEEHR